MRVIAALAALTASMLAGCAAHNEAVWAPPQPTRPTPMTVRLAQLPPAGERIVVAVYNFTDQTGQFKPSDNGQTLSRAVTQGASSILVKGLQETGQRRWFTVIEREKLDNLLRERAVIREMRSAYLGERTLNPQALPPLLFAGVLLEGGIIGFDSNTKTGGAGARFLGIGGAAKYREDTVTVYLRAVSVKTGEVLLTVSARKSIASVGLDASAFRFVAFKDLLEVEAGVTYNEPDVLALQQAVEAAIYGLVIEGAAANLWCLATTPAGGQALLREYFARRDNIAEAQVVLASPTGAATTGVCAAPAATAQLRAPSGPGPRSLGSAPPPGPATSTATSEGRR